MTPIVAVAGFVFDPAGRVLLIERGKEPGLGLWTVPGGRLEGQETLAQGVAREIREETGLVVEVGPLACVVERMGDDFHFVILDYLARVVGSFTPIAGDDARAAKFVDDAELAMLPLTDGLVDVLARARATYATWSATFRSPR
ncbi:MAG: NUDIX domain-containing protein [Myxococcales bacterium]|nr:NUDIX domain-containing protein [Myxococcales bacterium]